MGRLVLMRHGQASFGAEAYDALSELGHDQARAAGAWLFARSEPPNRVWMGPRKRHAETLQGLLNGAMGSVTPTVSAGLDEFGDGEHVLTAAEHLFGRPMTGLDAPSRREQLVYYDKTMAAWAAGAVELPECPPFHAFRSRVRDWLGGVTAATEHSSGRYELAITSAGVVSAAVCEVLDLPDAQWHPLVRVIQNASFTEILFSGARRSLLTFNSVAHLPQSLISSI